MAQAAEIHESEDQLISTAQQAISHCRWVVGECAAKWTKRYARGRTDADFGALIGLSGDQVYQRRRVWETFADVQQQFASLKWSHFYAALTWDDAPECLQWAEETASTVAEMKAWRRAQRGEDLTSEPEADEATIPIGYLNGESAFVQDPAAFAEREGERSRAGVRTPGSAEEETARLAGVARGIDQFGGDYAPFHEGAIRPPAKEQAGPAVAEPQVSPEQLAKRLCSTLERCTKAITPEFAREFRSLPPKLRDRLLQAARELAARAAELS